MKPDRIIVVTGTSRGLGRGLAEHFLTQGAIVCGCSRDVAKDLIDHPSYTHFTVDVSDETQVVGMVRKIMKRHGRVDALINNAGIATMNHALLAPASTARNIFATNFHGTFLFSREIGKVMVRQKSGRIVNFTTVATPLRLEGEALYAASKSAVESFTQVLARELGSAGVTVNALGPTPVPTDLVKNVPVEKMEALLARQPIRRFGTLDDVTNVVDFFLAPGSDFITGQIIYLGGVNG